MKKIIKNLLLKISKLPYFLWNLFDQYPQLKNWVQIIATISALVISAYSFKNSIMNSQRAEKTYEINLSKDSMVVKNLEEINKNTKSQTEIITQQLNISQQQFQISEKALEEQISKGTPRFSLIKENVLHIDSLVKGLITSSYYIEVAIQFEFTGSRTAYDVEIHRYLIINGEIMIDNSKSSTIFNIIPNKLRSGSLPCYYGNRINKLLSVMDVNWTDKLLNKKHRDILCSEYDKSKMIFNICDTKSRKNLFDQMNIYLHNNGKPILIDKNE